MSRRRLLSALLLCFATVCGLGIASTLEAAKPAPPPPPPPPPNPAAIYVWREDLGGWLDTSRNLIWGYSLSQSRSMSFSYNGAVNAGANYALHLSDEAVFREGRGVYCETQGDNNLALAIQAEAAGDLDLAAYHYDRADRYYALADTYFADAVAFLDASDLAGQYNNWRIPTKAEALDAVSKGLFTYGVDGFNSYDCSPAVGNQGLSYGSRASWTADTQKVGGKPGAWAFWPGGGTSLVTQTSGCDTFHVRTYVP